MIPLDLRWRFRWATAFHSTGNQTALGIDKLLVRDARGTPILPATSIKGILRDAAEAVLRSLGQKACISPNPAEMCEDPAALCAVCQIFGNPRFPSPLRFFDARPHAVASFSISMNPHLRSHVAISRRRRAALEARLFTIETLWVQGLQWEARVTGYFADRSAAEKAAGLLVLSARAVSAIGGHRTRGLGWLEDMEFEILLGTEREDWEKLLRWWEEPRSE